MTCWKVGRFVQRIVSGSTPDVKRIRSRFASARQAVGSAPCAAASASPAASSAARSDALQALSDPPPQYRREYGCRTCLPSCVRRSLST